ncbi:unnamed protein product [Gadus morhua 'NCC']
MGLKGFSGAGCVTFSQQGVLAKHQAYHMSGSTTSRWASPMDTLHVFIFCLVCSCLTFPLKIMRSCFMISVATHWGPQN